MRSPKNFFWYQRGDTGEGKPILPAEGELVSQDIAWPSAAIMNTHACGTTEEAYGNASMAVRATAEGTGDTNVSEKVGYTEECKRHSL